MKTVSLEESSSFGSERGQTEKEVCGWDSWASDPILSNFILIENPHTQENAARAGTMTRIVSAGFSFIQAQDHYSAISFFSQRDQNNYRVKAGLLVLRRCGRTLLMMGNRLDRTIF